MKKEKDWDLVYSYTRSQALKDGVQVRIPDQLRKEAGIKYPVFVTCSVWDEYLRVPDKMWHQDMESRIWDMLFMFAMKVHVEKPTTDKISFEVVFQIPKDRKLQSNEKGDEYYREVTLDAVIGPMDFDNMAPVITIMKPGED